MQVEKFITYQIESQFPAIYRESGPELVSFVKKYYEFLETQPSQSIYEGRRLFEYRDIDRTLETLLIFYQKKYLSGLPFNEKNIRFIVKHILDLYRRKGSEEGLKLFFKLFYEQEVKVFYPSESMLKPSESNWNVVTYVLMFPDSPDKYANLIGKRIFGSVSKAEATVNKILFLMLNGNVVPVVFLNNVKGSFVGFEQLIASFDDGSVRVYGRIYGSLISVLIDQNFEDATTGNQVGDLLEIDSDDGVGAKLIVTDINRSFTGQITYKVIDGGWGYTTENTLLLVSNQIINISDSISNHVFSERELLSDQFGNRGEFIGRYEKVVGVKMFDDEAFIDGISIITNENSVVIDYDFIVSKNASSPGNLYPEAGIGETQFAVKLEQITNIENISLITDIIGNFLDVPLDSVNFNAIPPALLPMSGVAEPVDINTPLNQAFDLEPFDIGSIVNFVNINPGGEYINDVFTKALDPTIRAFNRFDQIITVSPFSATFSIGSEISQGSVSGKIRKVISGSAGSGSLVVTPYSYYGFNRSNPITYNGINFNVVSISTDFTTKNFGYNADINSTTTFAIGKVKEVEVVDSGFGYVNISEKVLVKIHQVLSVQGFLSTIFNVGDEISQNGISGKVINVSIPNETITVETLDLKRLDIRKKLSHKGLFYVIDDIEILKIPVTKGILGVRGQGITQGAWTSLGSHLNFEDGKVIQDSFFYQDFSYEILSTLNFNDYVTPLKDVAHVAGIKVFGKFNFERSLNLASTAQISITNPLPPE
jgi:hypothetical protein